MPTCNTHYFSLIQVTFSSKQIGEIFNRPQIFTVFVFGFTNKQTKNTAKNHQEERNVEV